jgi:acyl-CoA synthetase (AMP-forming)/AMP-acid ligase II
MQHANIELIFYEDLPLASLSLKEYERKGSATLIGNFVSTVEARVSSQEGIDNAVARPENDLAALQQTPIGELIVRGPFLPKRHTLSDLPTDNPLLGVSSNGDWCSTGAFGYFDHQARFWLTERR